MQYKVVGKENIDYVSKKTNKQIKGYTLHLTIEKEKCEGVSVLSVFVSDELGSLVEVNDEVELYYNQYGKVIKVVTL